MDLWQRIQESGSGEPGVYFTNNKDWGTNPCCEIALRPFQFCNLTEVNVSDIESQDDLNERISAAAFFGTLQAGFTDFHYLRPIWRKTTEKDALIGVGMTGIASGEILKYDIAGASAVAKEVNTETAKTISINAASRVTTIKPSGSTSCVLGTSSGIHAWYDEFYIRRMQMTKDEAIYKYLINNHPELVEDYHLIPNSAVVEVPQKAPEDAILRSESALELLERVKKFNVEWVKTGHRFGDNTNNVSATISVKDDEWGTVGEWMWNNKHTFNGLSVLPYDGGSYSQAPFETIDEERYNEMVSHLSAIDLTQVLEKEDNTTQKEEIACAGGACDLTY
jgi:ribonucleoside-diphosphate reductase alpha chain